MGLTVFFNTIYEPDYTISTNFYLCKNISILKK